MSVTSAAGSIKEMMARTERRLELYRPDRVLGLGSPGKDEGGLDDAFARLYAKVGTPSPRERGLGGSPPGRRAAGVSISRVQGVPHNPFLRTRLHTVLHPSKVLQAASPPPRLAEGGGVPQAHRLPRARAPARPAGAVGE